MPTTTTHPATDKQVAFIAKLLDERLAKKKDGTYGDATVAEVIAAGEGVANYLERMRANGKQNASRMIDKLMAAPKKPTLAKTSRPSGGVRQSHQALHETGECFCDDPTGEKAKARAAEKPALKPWPDVPAGHYAIESATGHNDLDFYRVDRPTEGKWAGKTFVKRVIGGHPDAPVRGAEAGAALDRILAADVMEARKRYGRELGSCARCNRHLTDELSRRRGIGPDCWTREGWNYDDSDILAALLAEGATAVGAEEA